MSRLEVRLRPIVVRHLEELAEEVKAAAPSWHEDGHPAGIAMAGIAQVALASAWSLGSTLSSNSRRREEAEEILATLTSDLHESFWDGFARPGEGRLL